MTDPAKLLMLLLIGLGMTVCAHDFHHVGSLEQAASALERGGARWAVKEMVVECI